MIWSWNIRAAGFTLTHPRGWEQPEDPRGPAVAEETTQLYVHVLGSIHQAGWHQGWGHLCSADRLSHRNSREHSSSWPTPPPFSSSTQSPWFQMTAEITRLCTCSSQKQHRKLLFWCLFPQHPQLSRTVTANHLGLFLQLRLFIGCSL